MRHFTLLAFSLLAACQSQQWVPSAMDRIPVSTWRPQLPDAACRERTKGWVVLEYTVTKEGAVKDVSVLEASPGGVFDQSAIEVVSHWRYSPRPQQHQLRQKVPFTWEDCKQEQLSHAQQITPAEVHASRGLG